MVFSFHQYIPPTIFGETKNSLFVQSLFSPSRETEKRNVSSTLRALSVTARAKEDDKIVSWDHLISYCSKFSPKLTVDCSQENVIRIFKLTGIPPEVEFSFFVKDDLHVEAYRSKKKLAIRDLINGFLNTLTHYSQIDAIVERLEITPLDYRSELHYAGWSVLNLCDELDGDFNWDTKKRRQVKFIGMQILAFDQKEYSADNMADAINLYLRSRNTYRALRELLVLPSRNTICDYFGKCGLVGGLKECERTLRNVFSSFNEGQKDCFISFDEIHITQVYTTRENM